MPPTNYVNVLVHGLFFMWLNQDTGFLELRAPAVDQDGACNPHHLLGGIRGFLQDHKNESVYWTEIGLIGSDPPALKPGEMPKNLKKPILKFSMQEVGITGWNKDANLAGKFILPWPAAFYSLRHDFWERSFVYYTKDDDPKYTSRVGDAIKRHCYDDRNTEIGVITCLQYTWEDGISLTPWKRGINLHCYFEPCIKHSIFDVDADLRAAKKCFSPPDAFDLQMNVNLEGIVTPMGHNPVLPPNYDKNDEHSLTDDPKKPKDICASSGVSVVNVSPANCPNFFVGP
jgi:hypothetical protein